MKKYLYIMGVEINSLASSSKEVFQVDKPSIFYISPERICHIELLPAFSTYNAETAYDYVVKIIKSLGDIFPDIDIKRKESENNIFNLTSIFDKEDPLYWPLFESGKFEASNNWIIIQFVIKKLLADGWELVDRDGLWFESNL